ncbi:Ldh family oxidoreductase [Flexivirga meconopsidis]|uniref:Ldh family oxidoreductase n=1 Tax=Flexivirga meconopsidis TaxID=2977121 RepID=UPI002240BA12|nr:Ldh family oxidoreductase [Flexivirga meconopsidis]
MIISHEDLHDFVRAVLLRHDVPSDQATVTADVLIYADLHGFSTHGCAGLAPIYVPGLREGRIDARARPQLVQDGGACCVVDGHRALGHATAQFATDLAVQRAHEHGVGICTVRNSTHFGSAGYYARRAALRGVVSMAMTNCGSQGVVPPLGGTTKLLGTNPIAAAVPAPGGPPFVLDMSTTTVASGKVRERQAAGALVPEGWLRDAVGQPVTHPDDYFSGRAALTWLGGDLTRGAVKGFGLGVLVELLCGPLAGADAGTDDCDSDGIGHVVIAIDPERLGVGMALPTRSREVLDRLLRDEPALDGTPVSYPGAPDAQRAALHRRDGIALQPFLVRQLEELAEDLNLTLPVVTSQQGAA